MIKYCIWKEMRWNGSTCSDEGKQQPVFVEIFLTAVLIGKAYKSEVTPLVASISRLFYMGNFALMGEPSMEQSRECHDGMAGLWFSRDD